MGINVLNFNLTPTQSAFVNSDQVVNILISNTGEGKSFASVVAMVVHAQRCRKNIRVAIVRDTHENIKNSTVRTIQEVFEAEPGIAIFKNDFKQLTINIQPYKVIADLFGIDDLASLSKLQGPEYALIWLEEPAPIANRINAGLSEEVFNAALVRCARQKGTRPRLQVSMNPADTDHWTYRRFIEESHIDPANPLITKAVWFVPYGENPHLSEIARQAVKAAYKDDPASYERYVRGQFATVYEGAKVTPEYNPTIHLAPGPLEPAEGLESFRMWDGWHTPACLLGQITSTGRLVFIDSIRIENSDINTLVDAYVAPLVNSPRWKDKAKSWRDIGDISMRSPDQSNRQFTAARVIEEKLDTYFEAGPSHWENLKHGVKHALNMNIHGNPAIIVNPEERKLHKALLGDWCYKVDTSGNIVGKLPNKNLSSHIGDAFANGVCVLLPSHSTEKWGECTAAANKIAKKRADSYRVRGEGYGGR
jgi:hypothetical protein